MSAATLTLLSLPIFASFASFGVRSRRGFAEALGVIVGTIELVLALFIAFSQLSGASSDPRAFILFDPLGSLFLVIICVLGFSGLIYSSSYLAREVADGAIGPTRVRQYYALFHAFMFSMFLAAGSNNMILLWIAIEATTLASAFLISFFDRPASIEAAWKYIVINSVALLLGLFGVFLMAAAIDRAGMPLSFDPSVLGGLGGMLPAALIQMAFVFILIGYATKAGFAPMHTWLPDAHSQAPVPVSAMLSGALLNIAFLGILRFKGVADATLGGDFAATALLVFGILSVSIAAIFILIQRQYKRLLAYSSIEHMGLIAIGMGLGGAAAVAALLHALYHSLAKSMLFLASGNIAHRYHSLEIADVRGLLKSMRITGPIFFIGLLAVMGLPPFGTFMTKFAILAALFEQHLALGIAAVIALALAVAGFMRHASQIFFGDADGKEPERGDLARSAPLILLGLSLVILGTWVPEPLVALVRAAAL
ncbi:MAG TPA: proton-conducting transporter membrane subunit [Candidatus Paceibacterota bacterium]|nr:proton-conducting transporter membrane subunit [Candidatus Paceibacterota bacterium]